MTARRAVAVLAPLLFAGCSSEPAVTASNESVAAVDNMVAAAGLSDTLKPGRWEGTMTVTDTSAPGANPAATPGKVDAQPMVLCIAADSANARDNPFNQRMARQTQTGCRYDKFRRVGGKTESTMTCEQAGLLMTSTTTSEITDDSYRMDSTVSTSARPQAGSGPEADLFAGIKADSKVALKRTGECRGDEQRM